jgi:hypothetical protein
MMGYMARGWVELLRKCLLLLCFVATNLDQIRRPHTIEIIDALAPDALPGCYRLSEIFEIQSPTTKGDSTSFPHLLDSTHQKRRNRPFSPSSHFSGHLP